MLHSRAIFPFFLVLSQSVLLFHPAFNHVPSWNATNAKHGRRDLVQPLQSFQYGPHDAHDGPKGIPSTPIPITWISQKSGL